jgi:hypothetical protein
MSYWDSYREIQRLVERMRPIHDQIRTYLESQNSFIELTASMTPTRDLLNEIQKTQLLMQPPPELFATSRALEAAMRPLVDVEALARAYQVGFDPDWIRRLSTAFEIAPFVGEVEFEDGELTTTEDEAGPAAQAEAQLVEIASPDALEALRKVEFAPLVLLDQILRNPEMMRRLGSRDFEGFVAALVEQIGFEDVILTPRSGDDGRDVLATKRVHGISIFCAFECKRYAPDRPIGPEIARALLGTIVHGNTRATKGVLVTTSHFTPAARRFILTEPSLDGKDFEGIVGWLQEFGQKRRAT